MAGHRLPIGARFWLVLAVLVTAMGGMGAAAFLGLAKLHEDTGSLDRRIVSTADGAEGRFHLGDLTSSVQLYTRSGAPGERRVLRLRIEDDISRVVEYEPMLPALQRQAVETVVGLWRAHEFEGASGAPSARRAEVLLRPVLDASDTAAERSLSSATAAHAAADHTFRRTRLEVAMTLLAALLLGVGMVLWLIRSVVPRTRDFSDFAARVSAGDVAGRVMAAGTDELADLGRTLNTMVGRHEDERAYQSTQHEFIDALQVTDSEDEAHNLLKRHLERSLGASSVVVLNRNNSDDRLEARTPVAEGSALAQGLDGASPRACLAIRLGRRHEQTGETEPLVPCGVCGKLPNMTTCDPLLVSGEVIGSVVVNHETTLGSQDEKRLRESVSQAAPVLANLRNLAIAELRAATDALTALPNTRAAQATLKRMVAQANRAQTPLAAILVDLDHFKQINDTYGHGRGDEVLAAAADAMRSAVRDSDFVARYGGEEFVILLPDTDQEGALQAAEMVRAAVAVVTVPAVEREVTASLGVAMLGDDGIDGDTLIRSADRALYAAKSLGRNRVASAGAVPLSTPA